MQNTEQKRFYITTTLPYVNGRPHIGYALEMVEADVIARMARLRGDEVVFNTGTDEHGAKIYEKAGECGKTPQAYCDEMSEHFRALQSVLGVSFTHFIRTTDTHHKSAAREFWKRCEASGDIYKKSYPVKYCVGCELEKTDSDLVDGRCPDHPNRELEIREEENYFFRFSKYQEPLLALYHARPDFVVPAKRMNEITAFVERGLQDFSISRLAEKMPWGIAVPGDAEHTMYVWFDALVNYVSTLGWPENEEHFRIFWPGTQIAGKDNLRQQAAMWQAMLFSAGLPPSRQILIHGHITSAGQKMSKSLGNVISPEELVERFGVDGTRYILLATSAFGEDMDLTMERMTEKYNADLANGLGNLVSRVMKLAEHLDVSVLRQSISEHDQHIGISEEVSISMDRYQFSEALQSIWQKISDANKYMDETKPWILVKNDQTRFAVVMQRLLRDIESVALDLQPFLPDTSEKILQALATGKITPLFQRI